MTDFFGSVRNVELHNDTQYHIVDEERFDGQLLFIPCLPLPLVYHHMILKLDHMILGQHY